MKILFLHGWHSVPGGVKPTYLSDHGHDVIDPALDDDDFEAALATAQSEFDKHRPQVVVGSSRGGAVAVNIKCDSAKLVLLCPAWKKWGTAKTVKSGTVILHSQADNVIPFADSEELVRNSSLPSSALIEVGNDHRLADREPLDAMLEACNAPFVMLEKKLPCCGMTPVLRLKDLPHVYGNDFELFRCVGCSKAWVGFWCSVAPSGGWEPVSEPDAEKMMSLIQPELRVLMKEWAKDFN